MSITRESPIPWGMDGFRAEVRAMNPSSFIRQYLKPLLFWKTVAASKKPQLREFESAAEFWGKDNVLLFRDVRLKNFRLTDWFPRTPGVYWSDRAERARTMAMAGPVSNDPLLGHYF